MYPGINHAVALAAVVLLAEDVDRNCPPSLNVLPRRVVLHAEDGDRNFKGRPGDPERFVVLLAEDVDRNKTKHQKSSIEYGRPPRGGRG